jgi:hypothetical protein
MKKHKNLCKKSSAQLDVGSPLWREATAREELEAASIRASRLGVALPPAPKAAPAKGTGRF